MTIAKLIKETETKIELFDMKLKNLKEDIHEARFRKWDLSDLLDKKMLISAKRQMCVQFIADLECVEISHPFNLRNYKIGGELK